MTFSTIGLLGFAKAKAIAIVMESIIGGIIGCLNRRKTIV
jgi:hypothetical protein